MARFHQPEQLPGATAFSEDNLARDPLVLVRILKQTAWLWRPLDNATSFQGRRGAKRDPNKKWVLAFLVFARSKSADVQPWWDDSGDELWRECGFAGKPPFHSVYERFVELELRGADAILAGAGRLIQHARKHEPRIGRHIHVDFTEAETHAALVHDCAPGECPDERHSVSKPSGRKGRSHKRRGQQMLERRRAARPTRVPSERAKEDRQAENALPPHEAERAMRAITKVVPLPEGGARIKTTTGHWYRTNDKTAGIRAYTGPRGATRFWHGFYNGKATDHYTGAPLAVLVESAGRQEYAIYPELYEQLEQNTGGARFEAIVGDKGLSVKSVYEHNTRKGVATVTPWRPGGGDGLRHDHDEFDRHGIPRCKHCGGPTRFVRFSEKGTPRLWFDCELAPEAACTKTQTISCARNWRLLVPLWRTDEIYMTLRNSGEQFEAMHDYWRDRYQVAGKDVNTRPRRIGKGWQQLRANAALLIEWLRICLREGWLGSARRNRHTPVKTHAYGKESVKKLIDFRRRISLLQPYGAKAEALGLGKLLPPSRRGKAADPPPDDGGGGTAGDG